MKQTLHRLIGYRKSALFISALMFCLPFHLPFLWFLSFAAPIPLFFVLWNLQPETRLKRVFSLGFWFGFCYHLGVYTWFFALYPFEAAGFSVPIAVLVTGLAYFGSSAIHGLVFSLPFVACQWLTRTRRPRRSVRALVFIALFLLAEALCGVGTLALPWSRIGLPQAAFPLGIRTAALLGPYGVDLLILAFGACTALVLFAKLSVRRRVLCAAAAVLLFSGNLLWGALYARREPAQKTLRVAAVQTNIASTDKRALSLEALYDTCARLVTEAAALDADLIVLPETVLARPLNEQSAAFFTSLCAKTGAHLVVGSAYESEGKTYNGILLFSELGLQGATAKRHLVPFGEYLPYRDLLAAVAPALANLTYYQNDYSAGQSGIVGEIDKVPIGGFVCFDTLFPALSVQSVREGAALLCVATNDSWFRESSALREHLWQGTFRAVETRRALVQSANAGISAIIDENGVLHSELAAASEGVICADVPLCDEMTLYARAPFILLCACGLVAVFALGAAIFSKRRTSHGGSA